MVSGKDTALSIAAFLPPLVVIAAALARPGGYIDFLSVTPLILVFELALIGLSIFTFFGRAKPTVKEGKVLSRVSIGFILWLISIPFLLWWVVWFFRESVAAGAVLFITLVARLVFNSPAANLKSGIVGVLALVFLLPVSFLFYSYVPDFGPEVQEAIRSLQEGKRSVALSNHRADVVLLAFYYLFSVVAVSLMSTPAIYRRYDNFVKRYVSLRRY